MSSLTATQFDMIQAPEPMAPLKHVIITPENIAREARLSRANPMGRFQLWRLGREARSLERRARRMEHKAKAFVVRRNELRSALQPLALERDRLQPLMKAAPDDEALKAQWQELVKTALPLQHEYEEVSDFLQRLANLKTEAAEIRRRIADNPAVIERRKVEDATLKLQQEEARAYEQLIIERFTQLGYCYRWTDKNGNRRVDEVRFSEAHILKSAVYFKIAASYRAMFGGYRTHLPNGVRLTDLTKDDTVAELALSCQRQVTAVAKPKAGAWIVVHRLDTNDGLVNQVSYSKMMENYPRKIHALIPVCVGVGYGLNVLWLNIAQYPHMLVAGFTGSGKSNWVNCLICTLIAEHEPEELRLVLVDLKDGLEFSAYEHVPHLHGEVIDKISVLADTLQQLEAIMAERNRLMRGRARSLQQFNHKYPEEKLPRIVCIIDEVASIMAHGELTKRINNSLRQLTAKGRAPGIHIILSTQRPSVDAIEGGIKVNLAARLVGRMPSHSDSLTVLGTGDAKDLAAVPGRMILQIDPTPNPVQTPLIEEEDIAAALKRAMEYPTPTPLPIPEGYEIAQEWTPERIVELSLTFLGGNLSHTLIWEEVKEEGTITNAQLREQVKRIWAMDCIVFDGKEYRVEKGKGQSRRLVEIIKTDEPMT